MSLEDRLAPGNLLGEALALAMPAQVMSLFSLAFEGVDSSAPTLVNAVPDDAPPDIDPGVTLTSWVGPVYETFTSVVTATQESAPIAFDPSLNDELFASATSAIAQFSPSADTPSSNAGAFGGLSASPMESSFSTNSSSPPASSAPPPVVPPPGMNPPSSPPTANNDAYSVSNGTLSVPASGVLANDTNPGGQPMSASIVASAGHGMAMLNQNGSFTYTANPGYSGTDTFTYRATAGGQISNTATVTLSVTAAPPMAYDDAYTVAQNAPLNVSPTTGVLVNDMNPGGQPMTAVLDASPIFGTVSLNGNGSFLYTPIPGYSGSDYFTYEASANGLISNTATVQITVTPTPPPVAFDDTYTVGSQSSFSVSALSGVLSNDSSPSGQPLTANLISTTSNGVVILGAAGSFSYFANPGYSGTDTFTYRAMANGLTSNTATVSLTVTAGSSSLIVTNPGNQTSAEGNAVSLTVTSSNPNNATLFYQAVGLPNGLTINSATGVISGAVAYDAAEVNGGIYATTVVVSGSPGVGGMAHFTWTVVDTNTTPTLGNPGNQANAEGDFVTLTVSASDIDGDPLVYTAGNLPPGLLLNQYNGVITGQINQTGAGSYIVSMSVSDGVHTVGETFTWIVSAVNLPPQLVNIPDQTSMPSEVVSLTAQAMDPDGDPLTYSIAGQPSGLTINATTGVISGTLAAGSASTIPYAVTVTASDGVLTATTSFNWRVTNPAMTPVVRLNDSNGVQFAALLPVSLDDLQAAMNPTNGSEPTLTDLLNQLDARAAHLAVFDSSTTPAASATLTTQDVNGSVVDSVTLALISAGTGQFTTAKPILEYDGTLTPLLTSLLTGSYTLVRAGVSTSVFYKAAQPIPVPTAKIGAIGDSLTAGMAYGVLMSEYQLTSYVGQFAKQMGVKFNAPLMAGQLLPLGWKWNGLGAVLANVNLVANATPNVKFNVFPKPVPGLGSRGNPSNIDIQNFAVPTYTISQLINDTGVSSNADSVFGPAILLGKGTQATQLRLSQSPTMVMAFIGNNDLLQSFTTDSTTGARPTIPSSTSFNNSLKTMLDQLTPQQTPALKASNPKGIVLGTIPDVTQSPLLLDVGTTMPKLPFALTFKGVDITDMLTRTTLSGPGLAKGSKVSLFTVLACRGDDIVKAAKDPAKPTLSVTITPTMALSPGTLATIQNTAAEYNQAIQAYTVFGGVKIQTFDIAAEFARLRTSAPTRAKISLTVTNTKGITTTVVLDNTFGGGALTSDGMHPTKTGQAVLALALQKTLGTQDFGGFTARELASAKPIDPASVLTKEVFNVKYPG